jgi:excinuclease UvrABC nuclease subunit
MTQLHYIRLAHALFDKVADTWIQLPTPTFAVIDLDAPLPYFYVSNDPDVTEKRIVFGLFPNRKAAFNFTETLNAVFCLCRNPSLLKSNRQSGCPYLQMKSCPGPCLDPAQQEVYRVRVRQSLAGANRRIASILHDLEHRMHNAASTMDFEKANDLKKQIDLLTKIQTPNYRWVHNLKNFSVLHVDKSSKRPVEGSKRKVLHYRWLKIVSGAVYDLGDFVPESHDDVNRFLEQKWSTAPEILYAHKTREHLGNLAYFLFRSKPGGFWLDCTDGIAAERLYSGLDEFLQPPPETSAEKKDAEQNSASQNT